MSKYVFDHTDDTADRLTVHPVRHDPAVVRFGATNSLTDGFAEVDLDPEDVDRLIDALRPYGARSREQTVIVPFNPKLPADALTFTVVPDEFKFSGWDIKLGGHLIAWTRGGSAADAISAFAQRLLILIDANGGVEL